MTAAKLIYLSVLPQQHVDRATSAVCARGICKREHAGVTPETLPHARLEDGHIPFGMQSAAVDDGYASVAMASAVDELFHARRGFGSRLAVQVEYAAWGVVSTLDLSELAPIDTGRDVLVLCFFPVVITCR